MAADFQMSHPNICSQASTGTFGSKFVTVCVSGNESNHPGTEGYQVGKREIKEGNLYLLSCTTVLFIFSLSLSLPLSLSQVSNQCVSLVRDDCFIPTIDAPELGYIRESTNEQYVPDVFYKVTVLIYCVCIILCTLFLPSLPSHRARMSMVLKLLN